MASIVGGCDDNDGKAAAAHLVVIPLGIHSHVIPLLRLVTEFARDGITITFVSWEHIIAQIRTSAEHGSDSEWQSLGVRLVGLPQREPDDDAPAPKVPPVVLAKAFKSLREQWIQEKSAGIRGRPTGIVSDMFLPWTQELADTLEIPRYMFFPSGTIFARALQGILDCHQSGQFHFSNTDMDSKVCISGLPPLRYFELPGSFREHTGFLQMKCESVERAAGLLINSFPALEESVIDTWRKTVDHRKVPKIYLVGPLFSNSVIVPNMRDGPGSENLFPVPNVRDSRGSENLFPVPNVRDGRGSEDPASLCLQFLGSQAPSSVLYIAFGSQVSLRPEQIQELALGLEDSEQHFLWVIPWSKGTPRKQPPSLSEVLPTGFEARLGERCCIVTGWAPQVQILAHSSTGGFLTHCGWNSSLESIMLSVPMIAFPQGADQHLNCRYLVDELKVAIELQTGPDRVFKRNEVERAVRLLMVEPERNAIRSRVEDLHRTATAAVAEGGSKARVLQEFLDDIRNHNLLTQPGSK